MKKRKISKYLKPVFETNGDFAEWFGYYNYDPLNSDKTRMLCNRSRSESLTIKKNDQIELGYYTVPSAEWVHIGYTDSWNWQQGAMMQWLPGQGNENKVIYNCSRDNHFFSVIKDVETGETKELNWPIYGITPDGKKSISLDFERSYWCRAYHYQSVANPEKEGRIIDGDGIYEIDLEKNERRLLIDIHDVVDLNPDDNFSEMKHWVEHIMINPSGTRFCFLHRFSPVDSVYQYRTRICVASIDGTGLTVIPGWNSYMWSHFGWQNDSDFVIYTYKRPAFFKAFDLKESSPNVPHKPTLKERLIKMAVTIKRKLPTSVTKLFMPKNSYYQYYVLKGNQYVLNGIFNQPYFDIDGHPSFTSDGRYLLTDSYPDSHGYRRYVVYDTVTQKGMIVAKMPENKLEQNASCDLHPKLSRDNNSVIFDNTSQGKHSMLLLSLDWDAIRRKLQ